MFTYIILHKSKFYKKYIDVFPLQYAIICETLLLRSEKYLLNLVYDTYQSLNKCVPTSVFLKFFTINIFPVINGGECGNIFH